MNIDVNGQTREVPAGTTVLSLLDLLALKPLGTVVERNGQIVEPEALASTAVSAGDRFEVVRLVGGG